MVTKTQNMKPVELNNIQRNLIINFLNNRITSIPDFEECLVSRSKISNRYYKPLTSAIAKLQFENPLILTETEKSKIISCVNENIDFYEEKFKKINWDLGAYTYVILSPDERELLYTLDYLQDVLTKCGFYKKSLGFDGKKGYAYYTTAFENIIKLKSCTNIFYAEAYGSIYQLVFCTKDHEYIQFDLSQGIEINKPFIKSDPKYLKDKSKHFSGITTREKLRVTFRENYRNHYSSGTLKLVEFILN